jgi:aldehyde:ferredoxin oxidoreductase
MGKLLFVDLTNRTTHEEELTEDMARRFVGGYGIGARIIMERMKPGADPLGPDNIFGIGTGPLTLSGVYSTCRFSTMGKSPLTGYWGDANSGGDFANALKGSGYDIVFFEGRSEKPVYLLIQDGRVEIKDAAGVWGKDSATTEELLRAENGNPKLKVATIGQAGERMARIAAVMNDRGRAAARSGLGAVMGSKNLKAVACMGGIKPAILDRPGITAKMKEMMRENRDNPSGMFFGLSHGGTPGALMFHMLDHDVPIKNWAGNNVQDFPEELWSKVAWDGMAQYATKSYACVGCPIACGSILTVEDGKYPVRDVHKPEYETLAAFGPMCLNHDMRSLIYANELCNLHGLDTISAGATVAFAVDCYESGLLTKDDTDGLELTWGNSDAHIAVLEKMCRREGIGDVLADGAKWAAQKIGRGSEALAMHAGGEMLAMHDPRCFPGWGAPHPGRHGLRRARGRQRAGLRRHGRAVQVGPIRLRRQGPLPFAARRVATLGEHLGRLPVRRGQHAARFRGLHERHHRLGPGLRRDRGDGQPHHHPAPRFQPARGVHARGLHPAGAGPGQPAPAHRQAGRRDHRFRGTQEAVLRSHGFRSPDRGHRPGTDRGSGPGRRSVNNRLRGTC